jgi:hypothetical protein
MGPRLGYICARAEEIPLPDRSVQGVFCNVALPYMDIPRTLGEVHRVLVPGGWLKATLHPPSFTWSELRKSFPRPKQSLFRFFVFLNGMVLHFSGNVISPGRVAESCQTDAGMRLARIRSVENPHFGRKGRGKNGAPEDSWPADFSPLRWINEAWSRVGI